ncbi:hypothetical protein [Streptococcus oralis]|jgi:probable lipoprotein|uniref:Uncharacterized protein n=1 Tax=Streptococcus oralis TaxID=1303 RepID=A0A6N3C5I2_STROR
MVEKEGGTNSGASLFVDQMKVKMELEIMDKTETLSASVSMFGNYQKNSVDLKVDQKNKILWLEEDSDK